MKKLGPERLGELILNMFRVDDGEEPISFPEDEALDAVSEFVCSRLERDIALSEKQSRNRLGKTKQEPNKNQKKPKKTKQEPKKTPITNNQLPITNNQLFNIYGSLHNVKLTDDELQKLKDRFTDYQDRIERLSLYIASKGDHYKSHYATILNWARKDNDNKVVKPTEFNSGYMKRSDDDYDYSKLIKN